MALGIGQPGPTVAGDRVIGTKKKWWPTPLRFRFPICIKYFGNPRISGSHHIFKTPWQGDPKINIQKHGNMAKEYQVKAVEKLQLENNKPGGKKHGKK